MLFHFDSCSSGLVLSAYMGHPHIKQPLPSDLGFLWGHHLAAELVLTFPTLDLVPGSFLHFLWQWPQTALKSQTDPLSSNSSLLWPAPLASYTLKGHWVSQLKRYVTVLTHGCRLFVTPPFKWWNLNSPPLEHGPARVICF